MLDFEIANIFEDNFKASLSPLDIQNITLV